MNGHETNTTTTTVSEETAVAATRLDEQPQSKELGLFTGLTEVASSFIYLELIDDSSHNNSLSRTSTSSSYAQSQSTLDYESSCEEYSPSNLLNEQSIKDRLRSNTELSSQIQNLYVLYGNRSILAVVATSAATHSINDLANALIATLGVPLQRRPLPYTPTASSSSVTNSGNRSLVSCDNVEAVTSSLVLVSELSDRQLALVAADKSEALKIIEAKTGLRLKKIKKSFYFSGLLFQFVLLNAIIADRMRQLAIDAALLAEKVKKENCAAEATEKETKRKENEDQHSATLAGTSTNSISSSSSSSSSTVVSNRSPGIDWTEYYLKSERRLQFRLKSTHLPSFAYDCYIFQSDLTDLNCDALVNASNASLHPGYNYSTSGDEVVAVARRIREKGGKQMQDSLKKILLQLAPAKLNDSEVVMTKSHGRLRSRYVLHAVTPTWNKYVLEKQNVAGFEPRMEETLHNVLRKAHDPALALRSLAFPVASPQVGGAFDMPVRLFAHLLYTALATFELDEAAMSLELTKVCVCSVEPSVVEELCSVFAAYSEMCEQTSWALPESPMNEIVHEIYPNEFDLLKVSPSPPPSPPMSNENSLDEKPSTNSTIESHQEDTTLLSNTSMGDMSSLLDTTANAIMTTTTTIATNANTSSSNNEDDESLQHNLAESVPTSSSSSSSTTAANNSNSSGDESAATSSDEHPTPTSMAPPPSQSIPIPQTQQPPPQQQPQHPPNFCLFCQREKNLFSCGNSSCTSAFCSRCISHHFKQQSHNTSMNKCPGCKQLINNRSLLTRIGLDHNATANNYSFSSTSSSSSSLSISPVRFQQQSAHHVGSVPTTTATTTGRRFRDSGGSNHSSVGSVGGNSSFAANASHHHQQPHHVVKYPFYDAKIYIRKVDQPCEGYEDFKSILITFDAPDGIQNNQHPKPGQPYKGTIKRAYLPEIKEHLEILAFYERALKAGMLFKIDFARSHNEYRVLLNQDVILKTNLLGGGKFGYPDPNYIENLLKMARSFSS